MSRLSTVQSIFQRYQSFSARGNYVVAMSLFERGKLEAQPTDKKILFVYLFYLLMNSCETVIRLTRILTELHDEDPLKNLLKDDKSEFAPEKLNALLEQIIKYEQSPVLFFTELCKLEVQNSDSEKEAIKGIVSGIISALRNVLATNDTENRVLWNIYNRLKHGFSVLNKEEQESVVFYLLEKPLDKGANPSEIPIELKINETIAKTWLDTIHALSNTQQNLAHLIGNFHLI